jgi:hypothetical protein
MQGSRIILAIITTIGGLQIKLIICFLQMDLFWRRLASTSSVDSTVISGESDSQSGTDTPASSVGPETANINPHLLESYKPKVTEPLLRRSKRLRLQ